MQVFCCFIQIRTAKEIAKGWLKSLCLYINDVMKLLHILKIRKTFYASFDWVTAVRNYADLIFC